MFINFHRYNHIPTRNACAEALKPDNFEQIITEWKADCEESKREFEITEFVSLS